MGKSLWVALAVGVLGLAGAAYMGRAERSGAEAIAVFERYGSSPKGVILEEPLRGMPAISHVEYDGRSNRFSLNRGAFTYGNPVSKDDFKTICRSLGQNERIGVSIKKDKSFFTYGALPSATAVARDLAKADEILGGTVFAIPEFIRGARLPQNYKPKPVNNRKVWSVATFKFHGYAVAGGPGGNDFRRAGFLFDAKLIPVEQFQRAADGGFLPHRGNLSRGILGEQEDIENLNFIQRNQNEFFAMREIARAIEIGEATAFARNLQAAGFNLTEVANGIR